MIVRDFLHRIMVVYNYYNIHIKLCSIYDITRVFFVHCGLRDIHLLGIWGCTNHIVLFLYCFMLVCVFRAALIKGFEEKVFFFSLYISHIIITII